MRVVIVWREESDYARQIIEWLHDCERRVGKAPESFDPDEGDGISVCQAYDVVEYPTMLAIGDDGQVLQEWKGIEALPRIDDVSYYLMEH